MDEKTVLKAPMVHGLSESIVGLEESLVERCLYGREVKEEEKERKTRRVTRLFGVSVW